MSVYKTIFYKFLSFLADIAAKINWTKLVSFFRGGRPGYNLKPEDLDILKTMLADGYYMILTHRKTHFTSVLITFMAWVKTSKWSKYTHVLMNLDLEESADAFEKFKLMEATGRGVHYSSFMEVFDVDAVCLISPKNMTKEDWDAVMKTVAEQLGKPYDNLFNLNDDSHVSCVEMVLDALNDALPDLEQKFPDLVAQIKKYGNLTPQMYRDCTDFEVILEIRR